MNSRNASSGEGNGSKLPQMTSGTSSTATYSPLSELMRAIILRVVDDSTGISELREDALEYLFDKDDEYIFSFISICNHLGLDPAKTREHILKPKHRIATRRRAS